MRFILHQCCPAIASRKIKKAKLKEEDMIKKKSRVEGP